MKVSATAKKEERGLKDAMTLRTGARAVVPLLGVSAEMPVVRHELTYLLRWWASLSSAMFAGRKRDSSLRGVRSK
jgi:hypothetical protein